MFRIKYLLFVLLSISIFGCHSHDEDGHDGHDHEDQPHSEEEHEGHDHGDQSHSEEEHDEGQDDEVHLLQTQMDVMAIQTGHFQYLNLSTTVKANGQLELPPQNKASVSAIIGGRVKRIHVLAGDRVRKGQTLATLEHPDIIKVQQSYLEALSQMQYMDQDYLRHKKLYEEKVISAEEFQKTESEFKMAVAQMRSYQSQLQLLNINEDAVKSGNIVSAIPLRSPISGYVRLVEVNIGKYVIPEQEMFEIVDNDHIHMDLKVYEKDWGKLKNGQKVLFSISTNPDSVFAGKIFAIGKSFEQQPKAVTVHAEIDNKQGALLPGMYVDARIVTNEEKVRALPNDAIVSNGGLSYIFIQKPSSSHSHAEGEEHVHYDPADHEGEYIFKKVEVNTGASDIGFTEIVPVDKQAENVLVVTHGAYYLLAEMRKGEGGHGHHH